MTRTLLRLEARDDHIWHRYRNEPRKWPEWKEKPPRPWVARLTGLDTRYGYSRDFIDGQKDYSKANRCGSRGVFLEWALEPGIYEIKEFTGKKNHTRRYFAKVDGQITEIDESEARRWLLENAVWELASSTPPDAESLSASISFLESVLASLAAKIPPSCSTLPPTKLESAAVELACSSST